MSKKPNKNNLNSSVNPTKDISESLQHKLMNKRDSVNKGVLLELELCLYLIRKGFTIILTVEQRKSIQMMQRYRTMKILDSEKNEVFNRFKHYEVVTIDGLKELKTNEKGYPVETTQPIIRERDEKGNLVKDRRSVRNDVVILHVVYNIMMKSEANSSEHLIRKGTKQSKENKVSKFRLIEMPIVNDHGKTEGYTNDKNYRIQESLLFHDILTCYFVKNENTIPQNEIQNENVIPQNNFVYTLKYFIIGNLYQILFDELDEEEKQYCELMTRDYFLQLMRSNLNFRFNYTSILNNTHNDEQQ